MINDYKQKLKVLAAVWPALLLTACVNHMEGGEYISTGEIMAGAFANLLIGMGTVFAVLIFLTWVISLFRYVGNIESMLTKQKQPQKTERRRRKHADAKTAAGTGEETGTAPVITGITPVPADEELAAVIAAAIAAYEEDAAQGAAPGPVRQKQPALQNGIRIQSYRRA